MDAGAERLARLTVQQYAVVPLLRLILCFLYAHMLNTTLADELYWTMCDGGNSEITLSWLGWSA